MKKIISIVLALLCCLGISACSKKDDVPEGYQLVSGKDDAYCFYAPTQWSVNNAGGVYSAYYSLKDASMVVVNNYIPEDDEFSLDNLWAKAEKSYKDMYKNYQFIGQTPTTMGGHNAVSYTFTATIGDADYKVMETITANGSRYYTMTYISSPDLFDSHLEAVKGMIEVFAFK